MATGSWLLPGRAALVAVLVTAALISPASNATAAEAPKRAPVPVKADAEADGVVVKPGTAANGATAPRCTASASGESLACLRVLPPQPSSRRAGKDIIPTPEWCVGGGLRSADRTEVCEVFPVEYETFQLVEGRRIRTGLLELSFFSYAYSAVDLKYWAHQMQFASYAGWGAALGARISGTAKATGACKYLSGTFPSQPALPFGVLRSGDAQFETTATAIGAVGRCTTTWNMTFNTPTYPPAVLPRSISEIRCDNAIGDNGFRKRRVGCVVPWFPSALYYSRSSYPSLALHVSKAQASGLPGPDINKPLTRTTNQAIIDRNRALACGNPPSIPNLSCDEYPIATSAQGLSAGGRRRTFDGCNINERQENGPTGASACMITARENNAQGGLNSAFWYDERVMHADPFRILIGS
jgi:hypothetical protein